MTTLHSEAEFTQPNVVCPRPEWWHAPDSDSMESEVAELVAGLVRAIQPELVIETGTGFGSTAIHIGRALVKNGHGQLVTFEIDHGRVLIAKNRTKHLPVQVVEESSVHWLSRSSSAARYGEGIYPEHWCELMLFDSAYELRAEEFRLARNHVVRAGAIVAFHDWTSGIRGHYHDVKADVERLRGEGLLRPVYVPSPRGLAIAEVT